MWPHLVKFALFAVIGIAVFVPGALSRLSVLVQNPGLLLEAARSGGAAVVARPVPSQEGSPLAHLAFVDFAWRADGAVVATEVGMPVFLDTVFDAWQSTTQADAPMLLAPVPLVQNCALAAPAEGARVAMVAAVDSPMQAGVLAWEAADFRAAVADAIRSQRTTGAIARAAGKQVSKSVRYQSFDVAISETARPVHLLLQGNGTRRLWNLHLAEGAQLSGVTLLGGEADALAHLPEGVPVEAIGWRAMVGCGGAEAYPYDPEGFFHKTYRDGVVQDAEFQRMNAAQAARAAAWSAWLQARFGADPEARVGYATGVAALIGPLPEAGAEIRWRPLQGAPLRVAEGAGEVSVSIDAGVDDFAKAVTAKALELAGGSFEAMRAYPRPAVRLGGL